MPFQKGNQVWKKGLGVRKENQDKMNVFMLKLADGGIEVYNDLMGKLARGEDLTKGELEYMDRFEGWREYIKPKLARTENKNTHKVTDLKEILDNLS